VALDFLVQQQVFVGHRDLRADRHRNPFVDFGKTVRAELVDQVQPAVHALARGDR